MRKKRKREHVENYLRTTYKGDTLLEDVFLQHNALPDLSFEDIDTKNSFFRENCRLSNYNQCNDRRF